jgi:hypothetical protein
VAIIAAGSVASERAVKSRRSAESSTARMVSPCALTQGAGLHPGGTAPAEIGLEQRCQRRSDPPLTELPRSRPRARVPNYPHPSRRFAYGAGPSATSGNCFGVE